MKLLNALNVVIKYITEGFIQIFSPNKEKYPEIGVQPYSGNINHRSDLD